MARFHNSQWQQVVVAREQQLVGESESFHIQLIDVYRLTLLDDITLADTFESTYLHMVGTLRCFQDCKCQVWGQ